MAVATILFFSSGLGSNPTPGMHVKFTFFFSRHITRFLVIFFAQPFWYTVRRAMQEEFISKNRICFFSRHTDVYNGLYYGDTNAIYKIMAFFPEENVRQNVRGFS